MYPSMLVAFMSPPADNSSYTEPQTINAKQVKDLHPQPAFRRDLRCFHPILQPAARRAGCRFGLRFMLFHSGRKNSSVQLHPFKTDEDATIAVAVDGTTMRHNASGLHQPTQRLHTSHPLENAYSVNEVPADMKDRPNKLSVVSNLQYLASPRACSDYG